MYQMWFDDVLLAEEECLATLVAYAKEQIKENTWVVEKKSYHKVIIVKTEIIPFDFKAYMKGTGYKK